MKTIIAALLVGTSLSPALADSDCVQASLNSDERALCRAIVNHSAAYCVGIRTEQGNRACQAIVSGRAADAEAINSTKLRDFLRNTAR